MIQGGDPLGTGMGSPEGPGFPFGNEVAPGLRFDVAGRLAMANTGEPNSDGSQFFITEAPQPSLNGGYTIFGQCEPVALVGQIARVDKTGSKPNKDVTMKVTITRGKAAKAAKKDKAADKAPDKADADKK
jgi:peptidyl-prolyl cis-trans isomerase A (cyclophilin A)